MNDKSEDPRYLEKLINEEYKIWKKNTPFLYDLVLTHALVWPSLTVQWFPEKKIIANKNLSSQSLLLGTHTSNRESNYLIIADVVLPTEESTLSDQIKESQKLDVLGSTSGGRIDIRMKINHEGEVNRARYMPQNPSIIATKSPSSDVFIFDITKQPSTPNPDGVCRPDLRLKGHTMEGYGLSWNPNNEGQLLSSSDDKKICLWNISKTSTNGSLNPVTVFNGHTSAVGDVSWSNHVDTCFASVGYDKLILIWDTRSSSDKPAHKITGHTHEINCVSFNMINENIFATGSADNLVKLWDMRNLKSQYYTLEGHTEQIYQVQWSPFSESVLGSCGQDRRLYVWDTNRIGQELSPEDEIEGKSELLFIHGGHTSKVSDFSWNLNENWVIASVSEDNILQIWQMSDIICSEENNDDNKMQIE